MRPDCSIKLRNDVAAMTLKSFQINGIVKIGAIARDVRLANIEENVALEDIEFLVMQAAQLVGAAIEFDGLALPDYVPDDAGDGAIDLPGPVASIPLQ